MSGFSPKLKELLPTGWTDGVDSMQEDEWKEIIVKCEQVLCSTEQDMKECDKLNAAKNLVKDASYAYKETMSVQKAKIKYVLHVMKAAGKF
jgi:hypothetical protein